MTADVVIFGGGVTGLWCRAALERAGVRTLLVERTSLGDGQSVLSQGILHRGVKYAFSAAAAGIGAELERAYGVWRACLDGCGIIDLRGVRVLRSGLVLWSPGGFLARATAEAGALAMKSSVRRLEGAERPAVFRGAGRGVQVWEVDEPVVEPRSLLGALRDAGVGEIARGEVVSISESGGGVRAVVRGDGGEREVWGSRAVFAAGVGNEVLLRLVGEEPSRVSQRRPLHMVYASGAPGELFGHCVEEMSDKPRLTITTSVDGVGRVVWYAGGRVAEDGVGRSEEEQSAAARAEVGACVPWLDVSGLRWRSVRVDRAEGLAAGGKRPEGPMVHARGVWAAVWPTKLALAPVAAEAVVARLGIVGGAGVGESAGGGSAAVAAYPWGGEA